MKWRDPRYAQWLVIANELENLHAFLYGPEGYLADRSARPYRPTGLAAAQWIRRKCATGWWYWWDKTTIAAQAEWPLRSLTRVIGDGGGLYESTEAGRAAIARIECLQAQIAVASRS